MVADRTRLGSSRQGGSPQSIVAGCCLTDRFQLRPPHGAERPRRPPINIGARPRLGKPAPRAAVCCKTLLCHTLARQGRRPRLWEGKPSPGSRRRDDLEVRPKPLLRRSHVHAAVCIKEVQDVGTAALAVGTDKQGLPVLVPFCPGMGPEFGQAQGRSGLEVTICPGERGDRPGPSTHCVDPGSRWAASRTHGHGVSEDLWRTGFIWGADRRSSEADARRNLWSVA